MALSSNEIINLHPAQITVRMVEDLLFVTNYVAQSVLKRPMPCDREEVRDLLVRELDEMEPFERKCAESRFLQRLADGMVV